MTTPDSIAKGGTSGHEQPKRGDSEPPTRVDVKAQRAEWAERWFAGAASCPVCGGDDMNIVRTHGEGSFLIEKWRWATAGGVGRGRIEWRESAAGVDDHAEGLGADWDEGGSETLKIGRRGEDGSRPRGGAAPG